MKVPVVPGSPSKVMTHSSKSSHRPVKGNHALKTLSLALKANRSQAMSGRCAASAATLTRSSGKQYDILDSIGQRKIRLGVHADRRDRSAARHRRSAIPLAVGQAPDDSVGPRRGSSCSGKDRPRGDPEACQSVARAPSHCGEFAPALFHGVGHELSFLGEQPGVGWIGEQLRDLHFGRQQSDQQPWRCVGVEVPGPGPGHVVWAELGHVPIPCLSIYLIMSALTLLRQSMRPLPARSARLSAVSRPS